MLNLDEYNESLYRSIDKRNKRKNIIQNYSGYLVHATQEENHLEHHKYLYKEGDNYIYPEDLERKKKRKMTMSAAEIAQKGSQNSTLSALKKNKENLENKVNDIYNKPDDRKFTSKLMEKKEPNQINVDEEKKKYQEYQKAAEEHDKNKAAIQLMADVTKQEKKNKKEESKNSTLDKVTEKPKAKSISTASAAQVKVKRSAKHSAFDISDEEMNNYLMHGSINGLKSVETEKPSEETEDQKKKNNELMHYGVPRMKHGHRRWQNEDGSLTPAGRVHYGVGEARDKSKHYNYGSEPKSAYTMDLKPLSKPGERNGKEWQDEQDRLKRIDADQFSKELINAKELPESKEQNDAYWEKYQEGTKEYEKAQNEALAAEKVFFRIDDLYTAALEKYGTDSAITQAARKKYSKALVNFEAKYGYTPQEFD